MGSEPGCNGLDRAIREHFDGQTAFEITDESPITPSAFPRPIIHSDDSRLCSVREVVLADQTQDRITAATHTKCTP
jgi:hypothetical protein